MVEPRVDKPLRVERRNQVERRLALQQELVHEPGREDARDGFRIRVTAKFAGRLSLFDETRYELPAARDGQAEPLPQHLRRFGAHLAQQEAQDVEMLGTLPQLV